MVLLLIFHQVCTLYALRDDAKAAVGRFLDASILLSVLAVENEHQQLRAHLMLVADGMEEVHHCIGRLRTAKNDLWSFSFDHAAVGSINVYEGLDVKIDCINGRWSTAIVSFHTE